METLGLDVLFVCTANISRSPYAERRALQMLGESPVTVASAGIPGYPGRPMDPEMAAQLRARGADSDGHVSRSVTGVLIDEADLVLTFEFAQKMRILDAWPHHAPKVLGLMQFAEVVGRLYRSGTGPRLVKQAYAASKPDSMTWDIGDPYKRGRAAARRAADEIDAVLSRVVPALTREAEQGDRASWGSRL